MSIPDSDGGRTAEQLSGPRHAVAAGLDDLAPTTSRCNRTVRVWGGRLFDLAAEGACPTFAQRSRRPAN